MKKHFIFGIEGLDQYYAKALEPGTSMLVAGHPGAGKTTFASTICYANMLKGEPCLFVSFGEYKDRFYKQMSHFGMNFAEYEKKKLFKYIKLPLITTQAALDNFIGELMEKISEIGAKIVVVDGITPMLQIMSEPHARSVLQTVMYDIPRLTQGLLILIADLPFGEEKIGFGGIDFVADIVIIMKHRIERNLLVRTMELRKFRGAPITVSEIPFRIVEDHGLHTFIPPTFEEIGARLGKKQYKLGIDVIDKEIGGIKAGSSILIVLSLIHI